MGCFESSEKKEKNSNQPEKKNNQMDASHGTSPNTSHHGNVSSWENQPSKAQATAQRAKNQGAIKEIFRLSDANGDGVISRDELVKVFGKVGKWSSEELQTLFEKIDANGDGEISYDEFLAWCAGAGAEGGFDLSELETAARSIERLPTLNRDGWNDEATTIKVKTQERLSTGPIKVSHPAEKCKPMRMRWTVEPMPPPPPAPAALVNLSGLYVGEGVYKEYNMKQHLILEPSAGGADEWTVWCKNINCPENWGEGSKSLKLLTEDWVGWSWVEATKEGPGWGIEILEQDSKGVVQLIAVGPRAKPDEPRPFRCRRCDEGPKAPEQPQKQWGVLYFKDTTLGLNSNQSLRVVDPPGLKVEETKHYFALRLGTFDRPVTVQAEWYSHGQQWETVEGGGKRGGPTMSADDRKWHTLLDEEVTALAYPGVAALQEAAKEAREQTTKLLKVHDLERRSGEPDHEYVERVQHVMWDQCRYDPTHAGARCAHGWEVLAKHDGNGVCGTLNFLYAALLQAGGVPATCMYSQECNVLPERPAPALPYSGGPRRAGVCNGGQSVVWLDGSGWFLHDASIMGKKIGHAGWKDYSKEAWAEDYKAPVPELVSTVIYSSKVASHRANSAEMYTDLCSIFGPHWAEQGKSLGDRAAQHLAVQATNINMGVGIGLFDMDYGIGVPLMNWADYEHHMERFPHEAKKYAHLGVEGMFKYLSLLQPNIHPAMYEVVEDKVEVVSE